MTKWSILIPLLWQVFATILLGMSIGARISRAIAAYLEDNEIPVSGKIHVHIVNGNDDGNNDGGNNDGGDNSNSSNA